MLERAKKFSLDRVVVRWRRPEHIKTCHALGGKFAVGISTSPVVENLWVLCALAPCAGFGGALRCFAPPRPARPPPVIRAVVGSPLQPPSATLWENGEQRKDGE